MPDKINDVIKKEKLNKIFDCGTLKEFISSIIYVLPFRGWSGSRFFLCEISGKRFLVKMCLYKKSIYNLYLESALAKKAQTVQDQNDVEVQVLQLLRDKVIKPKVSPCVLELLYSKKCSSLSSVLPSAAKCERYITSEEGSVEDSVYSILCQHQALIKNGLGYEKFCFLILERCDVTFYQYMEKYADNPISFAIFKSLLFQIVYTIHILNQVFPGFRHNDLHSDNIMLRIDHDFVLDPAKPQYLLFKDGSTQYVVPYFGIIAKLIDFGFVTMPSEGIRSDIVYDKFMMYFRPGRDLLRLFNDVHNTMPYENVDKLLYELEPTETYIHHYPDYIRKNMDKIADSHAMTKNKVWHYKSDPKGKTIYAKYEYP